MFVVIETRGGILESARLFENRDEALRCGQAAWGESALGAEPDEIDPEWGGVARFYVMHWFNNADDVWVVEAKEPSG